MQNFLNIMLLILGMTTTVLCLVQEQPDSGLLFMSGSKDLALFANKKARGGERLLIIATYVSGILFLVLAFISLKI